MLKLELSLSNAMQATKKNLENVQENLNLLINTYIAFFTRIQFIINFPLEPYHGLLQSPDLGPGHKHEKFGQI